MKKTILIVLLSAFLLSAMTVPALSQYDWDVGVQIGDSFKYEGTLHLWESDSVAFPPMFLEFLQTYNESDWQEYTVAGINAENVTFDVTTHWKNGTETMATMDDNMTSSQTMMVIGANLEEGTEIRAAYTDDFGISYDTRILGAPVMYEYESGARETNTLTYDQDIFTNIFHYEYLWDKETGIQVYYENGGIDVMDMSGGTYSYNATLELIETNVASWTVIPEFSAGTVMLLVFVAITVSIYLYRRKH